MSIQQTLTSGYQTITFGKSAAHNGHSLTKDRFESIGTTVLTMIGERRANFPITTKVFSKPNATLTKIDGFLFIEELSTILAGCSDRIKDDLLKIYNAITNQAYTEMQIDVVMN